jgi:hypothetical protein
MNKPTMETLARRVERVEGENRRLKQVGVVALAVIGAVVLIGQATAGKVAKVVEAERFVLLDPSGETRAALTQTKGGSSLYLYDEKGKLRVGLVSGAADETGLSLYDAEGEGRAMLALKPETSPALRFAAKPKKPQAALGVAHVPTVLLFDDEGKPRATLLLGSDGSPVLAFNDNVGEVIWSAP